ncbi:bifunctional nicotinamidase/pyrazinamidase [Acidicapsa ligni]|uniref:bifunctional nicotinamidase/pyrazinamidase n=1 Tax=Acidicapsa ligni TaxID=542300 RepID=UPI00295A82A1|nr:bifunctional nicotinamidase/pyrazinamidase [Acidicapsa ligni]
MEKMAISDKDTLLVIDVQRDFCAAGALAIPDGDAVVPIVNQLAQHFRHVILTQDWHTPGHHSFAASHVHRHPYETIQAPYGEQTLWPDHCVQGTPGADFHPDLDIPHAELILRKGFRPNIDSYSAFLENDKTTPTGLAGYLRERGFQRIFLVGLAYDYCVRFSAVDAVRAGFSAFVIEDACRAVGLPGSVEATGQEFAELGVKRIQATDIQPCLESNFSSAGLS